MSKLDELIAELCPDGVEYYSVSELFNTRNGYTPSKSNKEYWEDGDVPWFRMEDIRTNGRILSEAMQCVSSTAIKGKIFSANSIIIATSATIGEHALITVPSLANQRFTYLMIKDKYNNMANMKYIYYYCFKLDKYCASCLNQGNFASVDMKKFNMFQIPLPPLPVQKEIVRILDTFTELKAELSAELKAELKARKTQYEYYRDNLLTFGDNVPYKVEYRKLSEISNYARCRIDVSKINEFTYVGVENLLQNKMGKTTASSVPTTGNVIEFNSGNILIGNIRPYLRKIWLADCNGGTNGDVLTIQISDKSVIIPKYLYYILSSEQFFAYDIQNSKGAKMPRGDKSAVMDYSVPLPPARRAKPHRRHP